MFTVTSLVLVGIILMFVAAVDILGIFLFEAEPVPLLLLGITCLLIATERLLEQIVAALKGMREDLASGKQLVSRDWLGE